MIELMRQALEALKIKVAINLEEIKQNEVRFRIIISQGKAEEMSQELNSLLDQNKNLLDENFDFINVQLAMLKFIERHKHQNVTQNNDGSVTDEQNEMLQESDIFEHTIKGNVEYSQKHPMFYNEDFYARLMRYYISLDNFEMCTEILKARVWGNQN